MYGNGEEPFKGLLLKKPVFKVDYSNRAREIIDLLYNSDEGYKLIDEYAAMIDGIDNNKATIVDADRAMWDYHPIMASNKVNSSKSGQGRFYKRASTKDFPGMVKIMKNYIRTRRNFILKTAARETKHPELPKINYIGEENFPVNRLKFRSSEFIDKTGSFAEMKWRLAEVSAPESPAFDPKKRRKYEINAIWESDAIEIFNNSVTIPSNIAKVGHWYRARVRMKDDTNRWSHWSNPIEFEATEPDTLEDLKSRLVLTELMYHAREGANFDFIELYNNSDRVLELDGVAISGGIQFIVPPKTQLKPKQFALVIGNNDPKKFQAHYKLSDNTLILGSYNGKLSNNGEKIVVQSATDGTTLISIKYSDAEGWPQDADGDGRSLIPTVTDPDKQALGDLDQPKNWILSRTEGGSPGFGEKSSIPSKDSDQDGLPDEWELAYGLNHLLDDAGKDLDDDGANNAHEYLAGTIPNNPKSYLQLQLSLSHSKTNEIIFVMQNGRSYMVEFANSPKGPWNAISNNLFSPETGDNEEIKRIPINVNSNKNKSFYRLKVQRLAD